MNTNDLANRLNGLQYRDDIDADILLEARENDLVIVTGSSDDLVDFAGAIEEEMGLGKLLLLKGGKKIEIPFDWFDIDSGDDIGFEGVYMTPKENKVVLLDGDEDEIDANAKNFVDADFGQDGFIFTTSLPHSRFNVYEDGELQCVGLVIDLKDLIY